MTRKGRAVLLPSVLVIMMMLAGVAFAASVSVPSSSPSQVLASEPNEDGFPFVLGAVKGADNNIIPILTYNIGSSPGTVPMDGTVYNYPVSELFAQYFTSPDSDHPDGTAYFWIYDDIENVYFVADWTSDNTYDDGEDYFTVYINDGTGVKAYTQHSDGGEYGQALFAVTEMMDEEHMYYIIAVPKADLSSETLKVGFELFGTASVTGTISWNSTPPTTGKVGSNVSFPVKWTTSSVAYELSQTLIMVEYDDESDLDDFASKVYGFDSSGFKFGGTYDGDVKEIGRTSFTLPGTAAGSGVVNFNVKFSTEGEHSVAVFIFYNSTTTDGNRWSSATPLTADITISEKGEESNAWMIIAIIAAVAAIGIAVAAIFLKKP